MEVTRSQCLLWKSNSRLPKYLPETPQPYLAELDKHACLLDSEGGSLPLFSLPYQKYCSGKGGQITHCKGGGDGTETL